MCSMESPYLSQRLGVIGRFGSRPFPLRRLVAAAKQGAAGEAIRSHRLAMTLLTIPSRPPVASAAGRIVWLAARNWCRFPPGRLR
jgi:hypothetical protein